MKVIPSIAGIAAHLLRFVLNLLQVVAGLFMLIWVVLRACWDFESKKRERECNKILERKP